MSSNLSFEDCRSALDRALASPNGIRVSFETKGQAYRFRQRLNTFRAKDRARNTSIYPQDHPQHNRSVWDTLVFELSEAEPAVLLLPGHRLQIEEL